MSQFSRAMAPTTGFHNTSATPITANGRRLLDVCDDDARIRAFQLGLPVDCNANGNLLSPGQAGTSITPQDAQNLANAAAQGADAAASAGETIGDALSSAADAVVPVLEEVGEFLAFL